MNSSVTDSEASFRLVHLSDPHLTSLENVRWYELLNKRILGYLSWRIRRKNAHRSEVLQKLQSDFVAMNPDHIVISGDLTHIGTEDECLQALSWLKQLDHPERVSVIPGNHDCYAPAKWEKTLGHWQAYMDSDETQQETLAHYMFPTLRRRGPIALIGLSTALPTYPFLASGKISAAQLTLLDKILECLKQENLFRVITLHHGPVAGTTSRRRGLDNAAELRAILAKHGAELILHGHGHRFFHGSIDSKTSAIPVFAVPSASARSDNPEKRAGYNIYDIQSLDKSWRLTSSSRVFNDTGDAFEVESEYKFELPKCSAM